MRFALLTVMVVVAVGAALTYGQDRSARALMPGAQARLTELVFGCEKPHHGRLDQFVLAQDRAAFGDYLDEQIRRGGCVEIPAGTVLQIEDVELIAGRTLVRHRGATKSWWVTTATLVHASQTDDGRTRY